MSNNGGHNNFADILTSARSGERTPTEPASQQSIQRAPQVPSQPAEAPKRGRPKVGKRSDPGYVQTTAYIREELHDQVKVALIQRKAKGDYSDLVGFLLVKWLKGEIQ